jgi:hypothetical protein
MNIDVACPLPTDGQQLRATAAPARLDAAGRVDVRNVAGVLCAAATITARSATGPRAGAP